MVMLMISLNGFVMRNTIVVRHLDVENYELDLHEEQSLNQIKKVQNKTAQ